MKSFIKLLLLVVVMGIGGNGWAQVAGDFQPKNATGFWSDFNSWNVRNATGWIPATIGQLPNSTTSVFQKANSTIIVDDVFSVCNDLIFPNSNSSKIEFSANSILSLHGDLDFGQTTSNIFSFWGVGAKLICTGNTPQSFSNNLNPNHKFIFLEINKSSSSLSFPTQNASFENITLTSGAVIMNSGDLRGSATATLNINGGTWTQTTGANRINGGSGGIDLFAININAGSMTLATTSIGVAGYNFGSLNIANGGILNFTNFSGNINITNAFFIDAISTLNTAMVNTPTSLNNNFQGTVNYNHTAPQNIINTNYGSLGLLGGGTKTTSSTLNILRNINISGTAILPLSASIGVNIGGNWTNYGTTGVTENTSTVNFNGTGTQSINTIGGEDFFKVTKTGNGTLIQNSDVRFSGTSSELNISAGIFDAGTNVLIGTGSTGLIMSGGTLKLGKLATVLPEFTITGGYNLTAGTVELNGAGNQELRGARDYRNLSFSTSGTKTVSSAPSSITGTITISNSAILDVANNTMGGTLTNLTMTSVSRYITSGTSTKPDALGTYILAPTSTIEFANSAGTQQNIRLTPTVGTVNYGNLDISGSNVGLFGPTSSLNMQAATIFKVTTTGTFNVQNTNGFAGSAVTAINNTSTPTIFLVAGSTINYDGINQQITNTVAYQNLKLNGTGLKTAPVTNLLIEGNFTRAATSTFNANAGRVVFQGTAAQTFSDATGLAPIEFCNISNTNTSNVIVNNSFAVQNELNLTPAAKLYLNTGDIILRSTNLNTAYITSLGTAIPSTLVTYNNGRFQIERYLRARSSWRLLATPVEISSSPSITNSWREGEAVGTNTVSQYGTRITGPTGMDEFTQRSSMKSYNGNNNNYAEVNTPAKLAGPIANNEGYYIFVRGDRTVGVGGLGTTTLRIKGKIRTGDQTFSVPANVLPSTGFQSIGNPYPSAIDFRFIDKKNIAESYYIWNPDSLGNYGVGKFEQYSLQGSHYTKTPGGEIRDSIQSGEAFFVQSITGGIVIIKENYKVGGSKLVSREEISARTGVITPTIEINLNAINADQTSTLLDGVRLNFDSNFSNGIDNKDVRKINNTVDNLSIRLDSKNLIVERRNILNAMDTIFLALTNTRIAQYRFEIDPSVLGNVPLVAYLKDKFLQTETAVSLTDVTNINFNLTTDAASRAADRFMIVFKTAIAPGQFTGNFIAIAAEKNYDKTNNLKWSYSNESNIAHYSIERSNNGTVFTGIGNKNAGNLSNIGSYIFRDSLNVFGTNYYRVKATSTTGLVQHSAVVKVVGNDPKPFFVVQPNPVVNKTLHIKFEKLQGDYNLRLIAKQGTTILSSQITISSANEVKNIVLGDDVAAGVYELVLIDSMGMKLLQTILIK